MAVMAGRPQVAPWLPEMEKQSKPPGDVVQNANRIFEEAIKRSEKPAHGGKPTGRADSGEQDRRDQVAMIGRVSATQTDTQGAKRISGGKTSDSQATDL